MTNATKQLADAKKLLRKKRLGPGTTRYDRFCQARDIKCRDLARFSGYTSHYHRGVRNGLHVPTMKFVAAAVRAVRKITGDNSITANQLFPLDDDDDEEYEEIRSPLTV